MGEPTEIGIQGVRLFELTAFPDERGWFAEDYRRSWLPGSREMVQGNISFSRAGVLRGLHFHREQADWWTFLTGVAFIGLYDLRVGSPTAGAGVGVRIDTDEGLRGLFIPGGIAHGFYAERDLLLHYLVDRYYTSDDEFGLAWDDPDLGIAWPNPEPVTSERDRSNPRLSEIPDAPRFDSASEA
jgi:dTDP-4-dehydrorhamnose 3,5-epimerase